MTRHVLLAVVAATVAFVAVVDGMPEALTWLSGVVTGIGLAMVFRGE